jgi:hypothetical protein
MRWGPNMCRMRCRACQDTLRESTDLSAYGEEIAKWCIIENCWVLAPIFWAVSQRRIYWHTTKLKPNQRNFNPRNSLPTESRHAFNTSLSSLHISLHQFCVYRSSTWLQ